MIRRPKRDRVARLNGLMRAEGIASFLVTRREDVRYLSGFTGSAGSLLISAGRQYLVTDFRYELQAKDEAKGLATVLIQKKDHFTALKLASERLGVNDVWFDESALTVENVKKLKQQKLTLRGCRDLVGVLRLRKDAQELVLIKRAIMRAEESFLELQRSVIPGATERDLGMKLEYLMREKGSRKAAFDTIVASGKNGAMPHAAVTNRRIRKGDLITFDFGAEADGYFSDITRTVCVGRPSARQREIHGLVLKAQTAAIRSIRPGVSCRTIDDAARAIITGEGLGKNFRHGTGHGIGLMVHEGPSLSPLSPDSIDKDMVFTVEPGIYIPGWGGVRNEDMVQVTGNGVRVLTTLPAGLD